jgi:hypothetical protein
MMPIEKNCSECKHLLDAIALPSTLAFLGFFYTSIARINISGLTQTYYKRWVAHSHDTTNGVFKRLLRKSCIL